MGTTLIMALEEFPHLLSNDTQDLILASLHNTTKGDEYRVGGVDDDNLYPAYSNPAIMRALVSGYTGRKLGDANMTQSGENYAQEIIDLFDRANTLSEFNSGTYTGVSLFGLILWSKYLPEDSIMTQKGPQMLTDTWKAVAQLWNPSMKNMAGPWDRAYGYDMNRYVSLMALWFWTLIGKENSSLISAVSYYRFLWTAQVLTVYSPKSCPTPQTMPGPLSSPSSQTTTSLSFPRALSRT